MHANSEASRSDARTLPARRRHLLLLGVAALGVLFSARLEAQTTVPSVPRNFTSSTVVDNVRLSWEPPALGTPIMEYVLQAGVQPGLYEFEIPLGTATSIAFDVPEAVYYFRLRAVNLRGPGALTAELAVVVGNGGGVFPGAPQNLAATTSGGLLSLTWTPPSSVSSLTGYVLRVGSAPGLADVATMGLPPPARFAAALAAIPAGVYYIRVHGQSAFGEGPPSAEVAVTITQPGLPGPPGMPQQTVHGGVLTLSWTTPSAGPAPTAYLLRAGTAPGLSDVAVVPVDGSGSVVVPSGSLAAGTYFVRVSATSLAGTGPPGPDLRLELGPSCAIPGSLALAAFTTGRVITLFWTTPTGGPITGYTALVGASSDAPTASVSLGLTNLASAAVGPGTYFVRVMADSPCGAGALSNEVAVTVP